MKSEYDAAGIHSIDGGVRVSRLEESAQLIRALLDGEAVDVDGAHYRVHADAGTLVAPPPPGCQCSSAATALASYSWPGSSRTSSGSPESATTATRRGYGSTHFDSTGLEDRIAVVREAAGERFEEIELNALIQAVVYTDDREAAAAELAAAFGGDRPERVAGFTIRIARHATSRWHETFTARQQRFGVSYWTVFDEFADGHQRCRISRE